MTVLSKGTYLIPDQPTQLALQAPFLDVPTLIPQLLDLHPKWSLDDVKEFVEEKTGKPIHPEDQITLSAVYQRCHHLRAENRSPNLK